MLKSRKGQEGFTLIELLVVVLIIGILAAIAIPAFLGQKKGAQDSNAKSLLRNAAIAMESQFSDAQDFKALNDATDTAALNTVMAKIEPNIQWQKATGFAAKAKSDQVSVTISDGATEATTNDAYLLQTESQSGNQFSYNRTETAAVNKCKGTPTLTVFTCATNQW